MSSGLLALLDDIAAIAKSAAASLDDVAAQAVKASGKAAGVVIDDAAVTPKYVIGLSPKRELPIVWNIAKGSLRNKILILLPLLLLLGYFAGWLIVPLLAIGGLFLCYEGYEKLHHLLQRWWSKASPSTESKRPIEITPAELERLRTNGAIRTDFILSAEIMAIAFNEVKTQGLAMQVTILLVVAVLITAGVYGFVALVLKADDLGLYLVKKENASTWSRSVGRGLIRGVPHLLKILGIVGTLAMLWVGGQLVIHSVPWLHHTVSHWVHDLDLKGFLAWCFEASLGLVLGTCCGWIIHFFWSLFHKQSHGAHDH